MSMFRDQSARARERLLGFLCVAMISQTDALPVPSTTRPGIQFPEESNGIRTAMLTVDPLAFPRVIDGLESKMDAKLIADSATASATVVMAWRGNRQMEKWSYDKSRIKEDSLGGGGQATGPDGRGGVQAPCAGADIPQVRFRRL
uniref:Uncharacterized protein n=1 Tax=mine drainage metagenome TaxID=410659 RepID=E6QKH3_9ZZZZ